MPTDVTSDQDFMSAPPAEQAEYLKSIDPDFAKAQPEEQRMYLSHVNRVAPGVSAPNLGGMIQEEEGKASTAGLPGGSPNIQPATDTMAKVAGAGIGAAGLAVGVPAAARAAVAHPILTSIAITEARRIPYVGKYIPPYAEFAPLLLGKGGSAAEAAEAEAPATSKEAMQKWWKGRGGTLAGEREIKRAPRPKPSVPPEGGPAINVAPESGHAIPTGGRALPAGQYEAPASTLPDPKQLGPGVIEGEYMDEPAPQPAQVRGRLKAGVYQQPGGFEPNQPALPARKAIPLPEQFPTARQPVIRTTPSKPLEPLRAEIAIPTGAPTGAAIDTSPTRVGDLLNEGLGGKGLKSDVPLRQQGQHIPVKSSAVKSYQYDPATKEFHTKYSSGDAIHVFGDVSPEEAQAFQKADSKGKAMQQIKQGHQLVAKIVNGKRVAVKPSKEFASASPD